MVNCGAPMWIPGEHPNSHIRQELHKCSLSADHAGTVHKHGGYFWLGDGSEDATSTQRPSTVPGAWTDLNALEQLDSALDLLDGVDMATRFARQWDQGNDAMPLIVQLREQIAGDRRKFLEAIHEQERRA